VFTFKRKCPHAYLLVGLFSGLVAGLAIWLVVGLVIRLAGKTRDRTALGRWRSVRNPPVMFGFGLGYIAANEIEPLSRSALILAHVLLGLFALGVGLSIGLGSRGPESGSSPLPPLASWSQHRITGLGIWFVLGGLMGGFLVRAGIRGWGVLSASTLHAGLPIFLGIGLVSGLILGLIYPETWTTSLACAHPAGNPASHSTAADAVPRRRPQARCPACQGFDLPVPPPPPSGPSGWPGQQRQRTSSRTGPSPDGIAWCPPHQGV
jgi:hypothetical protein